LREERDHKKKNSIYGKRGPVSVLTGKTVRQQFHVKRRYCLVEPSPPGKRERKSNRLSLICKEKDSSSLSTVTWEGKKKTFPFHSQIEKGPLLDPSL